MAICSFNVQLVSIDCLLHWCEGWAGIWLLGSREEYSRLSGRQSGRLSYSLLRAHTWYGGGAGEYWRRRARRERSWVFLEHWRCRKEWGVKRLEHQSHREALLNPKLWGLPTDSIGPGRSHRTCISNKFPVMLLVLGPPSEDPWVSSRTV